MHRSDFIVRMSTKKQGKNEAIHTIYLLIVWSKKNCKDVLHNSTKLNEKNTILMTYVLVRICSITSYFTHHHYLFNSLFRKLSLLTLSTSEYCSEIFVTEIWISKFDVFLELSVKPKMIKEKMILAFCGILVQTLWGYCYSVRPLFSL